ncbi:MAG: hypothetical protein Q9184_006816, partial [Pyrenodesmia sp. 2 TL-2023]
PEAIHGGQISIPNIDDDGAGIRLPMVLDIVPFGQALRHGRGREVSAPALPDAVAGQVREVIHAGEKGQAVTASGEEVRGREADPGKGGEWGKEEKEDAEGEWAGEH